MFYSQRPVVFSYQLCAVPWPMMMTQTREQNKLMIIFIHQQVAYIYHGDRKNHAPV